jgi:hypothetical protein
MRRPLHEVARERLAVDAAGPAISCYGAFTAVSVVEAAEAARLPVVLTLVHGEFADAAQLRRQRPSGRRARLTVSVPGPAVVSTTSPTQPARGLGDRRRGPASVLEAERECFP